MLMVYIPAGVTLVVEMVMVEEPEAATANVTVDGLIETVGALLVAGLIPDRRAVAPAKPLMLDNVRFALI